MYPPIYRQFYMRHNFVFHLPTHSLKAPTGVVPYRGYCRFTHDTRSIVFKTFSPITTEKYNLIFLLYHAETISTVNNDLVLIY